MEEGEIHAYIIRLGGGGKLQSASIDSPESAEPDERIRLSVGVFPVELWWL